MRFMKNYGRVAHYAPAYAMNDEFSRVLHQQMEFFSSNPSADTLNRVKGEVGEASIYSCAGVFTLLSSLLSCIYHLTPCSDVCFNWELINFYFL